MKTVKSHLKEVFVVAILALLMLGAAEIAKNNHPSEAEATTNVVTQHPECAGHIKVAQSLEGPVIGPYSWPVIQTFVICEKAGIRVLIKDR